MDTVVVILDACILLWLVGTWFYEGHHKRCTVETLCPCCKEKSSVDCCANKEIECCTDKNCLKDY